MMNFFIRVASVIEPEYRAKKIKSKVISFFYILYLCIRHLDRIIRSFNGDYLVIPRLEIAVTSRCSLKCKNCSSLMQHYKKPFDISVDTNVKTIRRILDAADQVNQLKILGGEPFLYKDLDKVLSEVSKHENVKKVLIITNGTIVPQGEALLKQLSNEKVSIRISYYGEYSRNRDKILEVCEQNKIKCYAKFEREMWQSPGGIDRRNRSLKNIKKQYKKCDASLCNNLLDGKLHHCARSSNGMNLGVIPDEPADYLDVLKYKSRESLRRELLKFLYHDRGYLLACDYCDFATHDSHEVIPGEQM